MISKRVTKNIRMYSFPPYIDVAGRNSPPVMLSHITRKLEASLPIIVKRGVPLNPAAPRPGPPEGEASNEGVMIHNPSFAVPLRLPEPDDLNIRLQLRELAITSHQVGLLLLRERRSEA